MSNFAESKKLAIIKGGVRSIASNFPILGGLAQAWNEYETHIKDQRLDRFFLDMQEAVRMMENDLAGVKRHIEYSGQFPALLERTIEKVQKEFSAQKRRMLATALVNNLAAGESRSYDDKVNIIDTLDDLRDMDLVILSKVSPGSTTVSAIVNLDSDDARNHDVLASAVVSLSKLESRGLIARYQDDHNNLPPFIDHHWTTNWPDRRFQLLPFGHILLESLKEQPQMSAIPSSAASIT